MEQCENCIHARFSEGAKRGVMDCDPDEYWCDANEDSIFCACDNDNDILDILAEYDYVPTEEDKEDIKEFISNFECPHYSYYDYEEYDAGPDPDEWYDRMKDEGML